MQEGFWIIYETPVCSFGQETIKAIFTDGDQAKEKYDEIFHTYFKADPDLGIEEDDPTTSDWQLKLGFLCNDHRKTDSSNIFFEIMEIYSSEFYNFVK